MKIKLNLLYLLLCLLSSCSYTLDRLKNVGKPPQFSNLSVPSTSNENDSNSHADKEHKNHTKKTNSLWRPGSATTFFRDNRSWKIGDIVRVSVYIKDNATLNNKTSNDRSSRNGITVSRFLDLEDGLKPASGSRPNLADLGSANNFEGKSAIARKEDIKTEIAAVVMDILPNGNMIINGHQEVRVNFELREIKIAGIIRPQDIKSDNSIGSNQIAEARISYGGRGINTDVQKPPIANEILNIVSPF